MIGKPPRPASAQARAQRSWRMRVVIATSLMCLLGGCASGASQAPSGSGEPTTSRRPTPSTRHLEPRQAERIQMVMTPLLQHMNHPLPLNQVRVGIREDSQINAANAGGGEFYITTGLLERASDDQLRGVLVHSDWAAKLKLRYLSLQMKGASYGHDRTGNGNRGWSGEGHHRKADGRPKAVVANAEEVKATSLIC